MHLTTTNPVPGVWRQNTRAGVIFAISFTRLSRRNARISAHTMRMRAYARIPAHAMRMRAFPRMRCECAHMLAFPRMRCECAHFCASDANARISRMLCECSHMRAFLRMRCDAMRMRACDAMRMRASRGNLCVSGTVKYSNISEKHTQIIDVANTDERHTANYVSFNSLRLYSQLMKTKCNSSKGYC